jgi:uncharacterized protein (DUF983 family)
MLKGTKLYSILFNKCPRCQEGDFFEINHVFSWKKFDKMHKSCPVCGEKYTPEPGFYFGAMYISYALYVAFIVTNFVGFVLVFGIDPIRLLYFLVPSLVALLPFFFRLARRIWINIFIKYDRQKTRKTTQQPV